MEMFEKASKQKLRFGTSRGEVTTEELWDLSLNSLNDIAKSVNKKIKESQEESFIEVKTKSTTSEELKLEILKHIINVRMEAAKAAKVKAEKQAKMAEIKALMANKANQEMANKSLEELEKMMAELEVEVEA